MKELGIVADEISRDFRVAARIGSQAGLRRYEIRFLQSGRAPRCEVEELYELERICAGEGLTISALSPGLFKWTDTPEKFQHEMAELFPLALAWAERWKLSALIVFGFQKPGATEANADTIFAETVPSWVLESLAQAAAQASAANLKLLIEPEPVCFADSARAAAALIRAVGSAALGINYDPCNDAWMLRRDPLADFAEVAPFIANVHIKDQLAAPQGSGMPTWVVPGEGMIDWPGHLRALRDSGYSGPFSLEPHINGELETIQRCKTAVETYLTELAWT